MTQTRQPLLQWAQTILNDPLCTAEVASSDASFRSYWRIHSNNHTFIVMDAPVEHEDCTEFIRISELLLNAGLQAPRVLEKDLRQGYLLLSDLGTIQYLDELNNKNHWELYTDALEAINVMQSIVDQSKLPKYDVALLRSELALFDHWFLNKHIGLELYSEQKTQLNDTYEILINMALSQPQTFVHRDFHSRNLMKTELNNPGILDFQDAVIGPVTYDVVSLLKDCYIQWPTDTINKLSNEYRLKYNQQTQSDITPKQWQQWFDFMGVQRHLKAIGIFCRLNYRDSKPNYLKDINLTMNYLKTTCNSYPALFNLAEILEQATPSMTSLCEQ